MLIIFEKNQAFSSYNLGLCVISFIQGIVLFFCAFLLFCHKKILSKEVEESQELTHMLELRSERYEGNSVKNWREEDMNIFKMIFHVKLTYYLFDCL